MDDFSWQVARNTIWKISSEMDEMDNLLFRELISPLLSGLVDTIDKCPEYLDSNGSNWQALEDKLWHIIYVNTISDHPLNRCRSMVLFI
jgi:hypothetical protein